MLTNLNNIKILCNQDHKTYDNVEEEYEEVEGD
jgi:hypothetical protein